MTSPVIRKKKMPEFIKMERSYLDWAGNKITELNAEVRELKIKLEKAEIEVATLKDYIDGSTRKIAGFHEQ